MSQRSVKFVMWSAIGAAVIAFAFLVGTTVTMLTAPQRSANQIDLGKPFTLTDYDGNTITEAAFKGQPSVLFFGFANCPEVCPLTVYELTNWFEALGAEGEEIAAYFATVDPERDTPEVLSEYLRAQTDRVIGITGSLEDMQAMMKGWRVYAKKVPIDGGDYTMDHTALIYMIDERGRYFGHISYGEKREVAIQKLRDLLAS